MQKVCEGRYPCPYRSCKAVLLWHSLKKHLQYVHNCDEKRLNTMKNKLVNALKGDKKAHECPYCNYVTTNRPSMIKHINFYHSDGNEKRRENIVEEAENKIRPLVACKDCDRVFYSRQQFSEHRKNAHDDNTYTPILYEFKDIEAYLKWKEKNDPISWTIFRKKNSLLAKNGEIRQKLMCRRVVKPVTGPSSSEVVHTFCTAFMNVNRYVDGKVSVECCFNHYGHEVLGSVSKLTAYDISFILKLMRFGLYNDEIIRSIHRGFNYRNTIYHTNLRTLQCLRSDATLEESLTEEMEAQKIEIREKFGDDLRRNKEFIKYAVNMYFTEMPEEYKSRKIIETNDAIIKKPVPISRGISQKMFNSIIVAEDITRNIIKLGELCIKLGDKEDFESLVKLKKIMVEIDEKVRCAFDENGCPIHDIEKTIQRLRGGRYPCPFRTCKTVLLWHSLKKHLLYVHNCDETRLHTMKTKFVKSLNCYKKSHECPYCNYVTTNRLSMIKHTNFYHSGGTRTESLLDDPENKIIPLVECKDCDIVFFSRQQFSDHMKNAHYNYNYTPIQYEFKDIEAYLKWKETEDAAGALVRKKNSLLTRFGETRQKLICRSVVQPGSSPSSSHAVHAFCTAFMNVIRHADGKVSVECCLTHYRHKAIGYLPKLTAYDISFILKLMRFGLDNDEIIFTIKNGFNNRYTINNVTTTTLQRIRSDTTTKEKLSEQMEFQKQEMFKRFATGMRKNKEFIEYAVNMYCTESPEELKIPTIMDSNDERISETIPIHRGMSRKKFNSILVSEDITGHIIQLGELCIKLKDYEDFESLVELKKIIEEADENVQCNFDENRCPIDVEKTLPMDPQPSTNESKIPDVQMETEGDKGNVSG